MTSRGATSLLEEAHTNYAQIRVNEPVAGNASKGTDNSGTQNLVTGGTNILVENAGEQKKTYDRVANESAMSLDTMHVQYAEVPSAAAARRDTGVIQ